MQDPRRQAPRGLRQLRLPLRDALATTRSAATGPASSQEMIQETHPGAIALTSIGCGADSNPDSGVTGDKRRQRDGAGPQIADEVDRLLEHGRSRRSTAPRHDDARPDRAAVRQAADPRASGRRRPSARTPSATTPACSSRSSTAARRCRPKLDYPIQTWQFGDQLAMVFLAGRGRRRLLAAAQARVRPQPALGQRLLQRRALLHPLRAQS